MLHKLLHITLPTFFILLFCLNSNAQDCDCTITEVLNNTVVSCDYSIGTIINVTTESEFINAINQANNVGGNVTILIADGTYQIASTAWYPYITASNVVIRSQSGNRDDVILTGNGMVNVAPDVEIGIYAVGDNITIADLTISDVGNHGIAVTGDNLFVHNVKIQNTYEQMIKGNSSGNGIDNGTVQCSIFKYTNEIGPQWYIGGLDIHTGTNWTVKDNLFNNITSPSITLAEHAIHFWDFSENNTVERNIIYNCDRGIGFGLGSSPNEGGIIRNNMISNDGTALFDDVGIGLETSPNTKVYNNSIFINYQNSIEYRFVETTNVDITNNLTNQPITSRNDGSAILTTNNENAVSAWFVDSSNGNLRLSSNISEVVNMGTTLVDIEVDIDQTPRPEMSSYDIGSFEFPSSISVHENTIDDSTIQFFLNPSTSIFTISSKFQKFSQVKIYNNLGQLVGNNESKKSEIFVDIQNCKSGIYYCRVVFENGVTKTLKFIVAEF